MSVPLATVVAAGGDAPLAVEVLPVFSDRSGFTEKLAFKATEPMLLLDVTGSMEWPPCAGSTHTRHELAKAAIKLVAQQMQDLDTAGKSEAGGGGVMVTTFANGKGTVIGDMNPTNFEKQWACIRWGGHTEIIPGWKNMLLGYIEEFAEKEASERPLKLVTLVTDGEADDLQAFTTVLEKDRDSYVCVILIGYQHGGGNAHQTAVNQFAALATKNPRVAFCDFTGCDDPRLLATQISNVLRQGSLA
jgi:hypothetical protein